MFLNSFLYDVDYFFKNAYQQLYHHPSKWTEKIACANSVLSKKPYKTIEMEFSKRQFPLDKKTYFAE